MYHQLLPYVIAYVNVPSVLSRRSTPEYRSDTSHGEMRVEIVSQKHSFPEEGNDNRPLVRKVTYFMFPCTLWSQIKHHPVPALINGI
jgi:hypothetical protein